MAALLTGFGLGFFVALQLGPMSLFLVRSTLRAGWSVGLAIGAGIGLVDALYAAAGAAGIAPLLTIGPLKIILGLLGAAVLIALGIRSLLVAFRPQQAAGTERAAALTPRRAFITSVLATASNPLTIASWAAIFAAASTSGAANTTFKAFILVIGVGLGSLAWVTTLATLTALLRRAIGDRALRAIDAVAGAGMIIFGCVLGVETFQAR